MTLIMAGKKGDRTSRPCLQAEGRGDGKKCRNLECRNAGCWMHKATGMINGRGDRAGRPCLTLTRLFVSLNPALASYRPENEDN